MEALSLDLRERIIKSWQQGQPKSTIARTFMVCLSNCHAVSDPIKQGSMGRPLPGFEIGLVDGEDHEVPTNTLGQIALKRASYSYIFKGYWREPDKTATIYRGEWYLSGDMARRDADGYFWFEGRS